MLGLKCDKTVINHNGVFIMLAAIKNFSCLVITYCSLFTHNL